MSRTLVPRTAVRELVGSVQFGVGHTAQAHVIPCRACNYGVFDDVDGETWLRSDGDRKASL